MAAIAVIALTLSGCVTGQPKPTRTPKPPKQSTQLANQLFIDSVAPLAQAAQKEFGVPASVSLGQSILESGWGRSGLSVYGGAYFGIKCSKKPSEFQSGCVNQESLEYYDPSKPVSEVSSFRTYRSAGDSFRDHGAFLRANPRYADAFATRDPREFIIRVGRAGYATDPAYAETVISLIDSYNLTRFDLAEDGSVPPTTPAATPRPKVGGTIGVKWHDLGGPASVLGEPIGGETEGPAGQTLVVFQHGVMLWTNDSGAHPLTGPAWELYRKDPQLRERLGAITTDQNHESENVSVQRFSDGRIVVEGNEAKADLTP